MTYTTLLFTLITSILPLTAFAKDVPGISRAKLCAEGYKVGCPEDTDVGNMVKGDTEHRDDPAKAQVEYGDHDEIDFKAKAVRKEQERKEEIDSVAEDEL